MRPSDPNSTKSTPSSDSPSPYVQAHLKYTPSSGPDCLEQSQAPRIFNFGPSRVVARYGLAVVAIERGFRHASMIAVALRPDKASREPAAPSGRSPKYGVCQPASNGPSRMEVVMSRQILRVRWIAAAIGIALTVTACKSGGY